MAVSTSPTTQKSAALTSSRGFPCFFNATDKDFTNADIYPFKIECN